jgi:hypothetical protein
LNNLTDGFCAACRSVGAASNLPGLLPLMPAEAGIQQGFVAVDSRLRGNDKLVGSDSISESGAPARRQA